MTAIVELRNATKIVKSGFDEEKIILMMFRWIFMNMTSSQSWVEMEQESQHSLIVLQELCP